MFSYIVKLFYQKRGWRELRLFNARFLDDDSNFIGFLYADGTAINLTKAAAIYDVTVNAEAFALTVNSWTTIDELLRYFENIREVVGTILDFVEVHNLLSELRIQRSYQVVSPVLTPSKIICIGKNYVEHAKETGSEPPSEPVLFSKLPECITGHETKITWPKHLGRLDPEVELAVVIGRYTKNVRAADAFLYVAGYTILNDLTGRDLQSKFKQKGWPWFRAKNYENFAPMGPFLLLHDPNKDPNSFRLTLKVNGEVRQSELCSEMIFKIPELIETISAHVPLQPGDVIATGTPSGIGPLADGDIVECEIPEIGVLRNFIEIK